ncbi:Trm112 family protein [Ornithinicoccus halotolerans]|uniref:Trm112 family protein n=1 Tax=Ornithinicoccus halotolerans TaxID=1748220 RepID=UPI0012971A14|nr:hypothetical protein [Ornithinicoccus halotolerans]
MTEAADGEAGTEAGLALDPWVREVLRCPVGRHRLLEVTGPDGAPALQCAEDCGAPGQRRRYPVVDQIPVLLADDAELVSG